jgi:hypothetical protein
LLDNFLAIRYTASVAAMSWITEALVTDKSEEKPSATTAPPIPE